jgi:hypothetical protein
MKQIIVLRSLRVGRSLKESKLGTVVLRDLIFTTTTFHRENECASHLVYEDGEWHSCYGVLFITQCNITP